MSEETNEAVESAAAPEEKKERVALKKPEPPATKVVDVYRLIDGEFSEFAEAETIDRSKFFKVFHREFTKDGEIILEVQYDPDGVELQKTLNKLNENGKIIAHELFNEGQRAEHITFELDEKGRIVKELHEFEEGFPLTTFFKYDDQDRVIEKRVDDSDGELQKRETFEYHPSWKDKIVKHVIYDEEGEISQEETREYEERDGEVKVKKIESTDHTFDKYSRTEFFDAKSREDSIGYATFNEKDKVTEYVKIVFDEYGREAEEHSVSVNDSDNFKVYYTYDDYDRVVKQEQHQDDKIISSINRRFGKEGNADLIGVRSFNRGVYLDYYEFEYWG
ncbi:MAG TPA: hypothetical protein VL651_11210 [Bacteroidia bacterium]|jgi:hypothetical protein|nr:hypothetical protein [Bacteroidia bacterium]